MDHFLFMFYNFLHRFWSDIFLVVFQSSEYFDFSDFDFISILGFVDRPKSPQPPASHSLKQTFESST